MLWINLYQLLAPSGWLGAGTNVKAHTLRTGDLGYAGGLRCEDSALQRQEGASRWSLVKGLKAKSPESLQQAASSALPN